MSNDVPDCRGGVCFTVDLVDKDKKEITLSTTNKRNDEALSQCDRSSGRLFEKGDSFTYTPQSFQTSYQQLCAKFAIYPAEHALNYLALGLASEAGEVASKVKKLLRDGETLNRDALAAEIGDVMWYCAMLATELGVNLEDVQCANIAKLASRQARNVIKGSGDNR